MNINIECPYNTDRTAFLKIAQQAYIDELKKENYKNKTGFGFRVIYSCQDPYNTGFFLINQNSEARVYFGSHEDLTRFYQYLSNIIENGRESVPIQENFNRHT